MNNSAAMTATVTVMVVDDQPSFRRAAAVVIDSVAGAVLVAEAVDLSSALDKAVVFPTPDLAIVDLHLGEDDGTEVCRRLRALRPELAVVLVSTTAPEDLPSDVFTCGSRTFLSKSQFGVGSLTEIVESLFN